MPIDAPLVLIGVGDSAAYRKDTLGSIAARHPVIAVDRTVPAWARPYLTRIIRADLTDTAAVTAAVGRYAIDHPLGGVLTYMEHHVQTAAVLAQQLGLPGSSPQSMAACRDKAVSRRLMAEHQVPSARSMQASTPESAAAFADLMGYPVIVKPRSMAGSAGVIRADSAAAVREAFDEAGRASVMGLHHYGPAGVLVEEYLDGPEISVETAVLGLDRVRILAVTRKLPAPAGTTQEYGHLVDARDPLLSDPGLIQVIEGAVAAHGITLGVLCIEVKLTPDAGPRIVEVNGRLGGDLLPLLVKRALGIELPQIAADLATGVVPRLRPVLQRAAAIEFAYPNTSGMLHRLSVRPGREQLTGLERMVLTHTPGARVSAPPHATLADRLAHWVVLGLGADECRTRLAQAADLLEVHISQHAYTPACTT
ncbi:ATP-grasp domain-containing protein [Streptomyces sp. BH-SS-21]|uniref:ATP-grasp domain-containing protein n=1 Tax=Streptomyces liliiviolaceus TaxID=2823109 RepID=A0A941B4H2_9ACTN|nr:ATP-grasp domain-containing protein [Streptomyces liliiviolaceus]MBQ0850360.1 ATP-grasp domain-containing protein [Streptomyces liliiviolaceus]